MDLKLLYGDDVNVEFYKNRIENLKNVFFQNEHANADYLFSSSGRAEILGNHTDHNHGIVMVASINCDVIAAVKKTEDTIVKICSEGYPPVIVDISDLSIKKDEFSTSNALVRGISKAITQKGYNIKGFTAYTTSNIFKGAGVSSSAAFEVLVAEIFNHLYLNGALTEIDRAIISQYAENVYFNKPCGILDQCGISIGSLVKLDFINPIKPKITKITPPKNYALVITNTGGNHASLTSYYASIRSEMEHIASYFGKKVLREISYESFLNEIHKLKEKFSSRVILRALHYFQENQRVLKAEACLKENDVKGFLKQVNDSGLSSIGLLQNCYVPGSEHQPVLLGIELSRAIIKDGACRIHGGGFAGSIIAFVHTSEVDGYIEKMQEAFGKENVYKANIRSVGTTVIK